MRRRDFILALGGGAVWPLSAGAQQAGNLPTIGFLSPNVRSMGAERVSTFAHRLRELGWIDGHNIAIEVRWGEGHIERFAEIAAELVRLKVDIIVTSTTEAVLAAKQATALIPIVFASVTDPVGTGLVASLARPGGNATGLSVELTDTAGKRIGLLRDVIPDLRLAIMFNPAAPGPVLEMQHARIAARTLGFDAAIAEIRRTEDIVVAIQTLNARANALYVCADPLAGVNRVRTNELALKAGIATLYGNRQYLEGGGLMSYGASFPALDRRAAELVDQILRGAKPADIPVEQPTKFELVINQKTAKGLGLTIPNALLALADEVID
jgi:putative tryptophan/tyrosine transport system substrate-binding protein